MEHRFQLGLLVVLLVMEMVRQSLEVVVRQEYPILLAVMGAEKRMEQVMPLKASRMLTK
jgi:hypothetical protein